MAKAPSEGLMSPKASKKSVKKPVKLKTPDLLVQLAHEVENLSREQAFAVLPELWGSVDSNYIRLGGVLATIRDHEWWKEEGYAKFSVFLEERFGFQYRKGAYLIKTYEDLIGSGVEWDTVKDLGWSKLRVLSAVLTKDNVSEWAAKAAKLTVLQLYDVVKEFKAQALGTSGVTPEDIETTTTTISFKVHVDQKATIKQAVEKARKETGTEYDAVALEAVCLNYLSGGKVTKPKSLKDLLKKYELDDILKAIGELWPGEVEVD